jgi:hypothetical protein
VFPLFHRNIMVLRTGFRINQVCLIRLRFRMSFPGNLIRIEIHFWPSYWFLAKKLRIIHFRYTLSWLRTSSLDEMRFYFKNQSILQPRRIGLLEASRIIFEDRLWTLEDMSMWWWNLRGSLEKLFRDIATLKSLLSVWILVTCKNLGANTKLW